jgi:hypothetical protein
MIAIAIAMQSVILPRVLMLSVAMLSVVIQTVSGSHPVRPEFFVASIEAVLEAAIFFCSLIFKLFNEETCRREDDVIQPEWRQFTKKID